jgi:hypothetical protein
VSEEVERALAKLGPARVGGRSEKFITYKLETSFKIFVVFMISFKL